MQINSELTVFWTLWFLRIEKGGWGRGSSLVKHRDAGLESLNFPLEHVSLLPEKLFFTPGLRLPICEMEAVVSVTVTDPTVKSCEVLDTQPHQEGAVNPLDT